MAQAPSVESAATPPRTLLSFLAYPLFFASGAAGLIYEVVWTRILLNTFGAGLYAVCSVLAAFMAGLAIGAWAFGRISDRSRHPLRMYALLELGIGLFGIVAPPLLHQVGAVDSVVYQVSGQNFSMLTAFRFAVSFLLMLIPTTMMGATLPVLSRFFVRQQSHLGRHVGALYAINTFGAVCGTALAGFWLIARFGLLQADWIAAALNFLVAILAFLLSRILESDSERTAPSIAAGLPQASNTILTGRARWVLLTAFLTGLVALAAQVLWTRSLIFSFEYLKSTTYSFTAMLTVFLAGLALGSAIIGPLVDRPGEPFRLYGMLLTLLGISILLSTAALTANTNPVPLGDPLNHTKDRFNWLLAVANVIVQSMRVLGVPTLLMGMSFPVAARVMVQLGYVGRDVGRLYALNTTGAICGSVLAGFVIIPACGLIGGLVLLGSIDALLGVVTIGLAAREWVRQRELTPAKAMLQVGLFAVLTALVLFAVTQGRPVNRALQGLEPLHRMVFYEEGALATVSVIENNIRERTIYVDDVGVAGTDPILQTDQKSLAHVPMMLLSEPRTALTVGFGSGGASYSLLLHDRLERIDCVEICETVLEAAPHLTAANHRFYRHLSLREFAAADPRYNLILDDARAWLRYTDQRYDLIATDCTDLRYKSNANLYDVEYFQACREHLTEQGVVVVWMPLAGLSVELFRTALRTFHSVFPATGVFYMNNEPTHYILLIGWQGQIQLDFRQFAGTLQEPDVRADLAELMLDDPVKVLSCFITGGAALDGWVGEGLLNTENHPIIEFESPKYGYYDDPLIDNLASLMEIRVSPREFLVPGSTPPEELERLARYEQALPFIIDGHANFRRIEIEEATQNYVRALDLTPEDLSLRQNLLFPVLSQRVEFEPDNPVPRMLLGRVYMVRGMYRDAVKLLRESKALFEGRPKALEDPTARGQYQQIVAWLAEAERRATEQNRLPPAGSQ